MNVNKLSEICMQRRWTIGFAESCTGGLLSSMVSGEPGVSNFFKGSVVSYAREMKTNILKVPQSTILALGEVSTTVALDMARGAKEALKVDWTVSITGIAGPTGGTKEKPVGTVCFAVVGPGVELTKQQLFQTKATGALGRQDIQRQAALFAFDLLLTAMN